MYLYQSQGNVDYNIVQDNTEDGIIIQSASPTLTHNQILSNDEGIVILGGSNPNVWDNSIIYNIVGINLTTGNNNPYIIMNDINYSTSYGISFIL